MSRVRLFPGVIFGLLGLNIGVVGLTIYFAACDASFAVEPNYDRKAMDWDDTARQLQRNAALGWTAAVSASRAEKRVEVRLTDADGRPIAGAGLAGFAFRSARASRRFDLAFAETAPGVYQSPLLLSEPGIWEFRLDAVRGADAFTASAQCRLAATPPPDSAP